MVSEITNLPGYTNSHINRFAARRVSWVSRKVGGNSVLHTITLHTVWNAITIKNLECGKFHHIWFVTRSVTFFRMYLFRVLWIRFPFLLSSPVSGSLGHTLFTRRFRRFYDLFLGYRLNHGSVFSKNLFGWISESFGPRPRYFPTRSGHLSVGLGDVTGAEEERTGSAIRQNSRLEPLSLCEHTSNARRNECLPRVFCLSQQTCTYNARVCVCVRATTQ